MEGNIRDSGWRADQCLVYKEIDGLKLPIQIFYPKGELPVRKMPAVVCIHGGAWQTGRIDNSLWDGGMMGPQARHFASKGMIGIVISYRSIRKNDWEDKTNIFDLMEDCCDAVRYIRNHGDLLKVDHKKIAVMGDSAGGHLALCLGLTADEAATPNLVIACNPITDCTEEKWMFCVKSREHGPALARKASPIYNVKTGCPPVLLMHGLEDKSVDISTAFRFYERMKEAKNQIIFHPIPHAKHAFILFNYTAPDEQVVENMNAVNQYIQNNM